MPYLSPSSRKQSDFTKLLIAGYELELINGNVQDFNVTFRGPKGTAYEEGIWRVHVTLPEDYPFGSPSIGFVNKILHPNIDEASGSVCLDVINQTWTPIYSLVNIFDTFLPQLLTYPNPADPLNAEAGSLLLGNKEQYERTIRAFVNEHASHHIYEKSKRLGEYQNGAEGPVRISEDFIDSDRILRLAGNSAPTRLASSPELSSTDCQSTPEQATKKEGKTVDQLRPRQAELSPLSSVSFDEVQDDDLLDD